MFLPTVIEVPRMWSERAMKQHQCFRPIQNIQNIASTFDLAVVDKPPLRRSDDYSEDSRRSPRINTETPVNIDDAATGELFLNDHAVYLSDVLGRSETSDVNSSISSTTTNFSPRVKPPSMMYSSLEDDEPLTMSMKQCHRKHSRASTGNHDEDSSTIVSEIPPRQPRSSYILYLKSIRDKNLAAVKKRRERLMNMDTLVELVNTQWSALSPEERQIFEQQAADDAERYQRELIEYEAQRQRSGTHGGQQQQLGIPCPSRKKFRLGGVSVNDHHSSHATHTSTPMASHLEASILKSPLRPIPLQMVNEMPPPLQNQNVYPTFARLSPPPTHVESDCDDSMSENLPLPPGMEIELSFGQNGQQKQRYYVQYKCISMTKEQAEEYVRNWTTGIKKNVSFPDI